MDNPTRLAATILLMLAAALLARPAVGQMHLRHETDTTRTVITLTKYHIEVCGWRNGEPLFLPSTAEYDGDTVRFPLGTEWEVEKSKGGMRITFPKGRTLKYVPSEQTGRQACGLYDSEA